MASHWNICMKRSCTKKSCCNHGMLFRDSKAFPCLKKLESLCQRKKLAECEELGNGLWIQHYQVYHVHDYIWSWICHGDIESSKSGLWFWWIRPCNERNWGFYYWIDLLYCSFIQGQPLASLSLLFVCSSTLLFVRHQTWPIPHPHWINKCHHPLFVIIGKYMKSHGGSHSPAYHLKHFAKTMITRCNAVLFFSLTIGICCLKKSSSVFLVFFFFSWQQFFPSFYEEKITFIFHKERSKTVLESILKPSPLPKHQPFLMLNLHIGLYYTKQWGLVESLKANAVDWHDDVINLLRNGRRGEALLLLKLPNYPHMNSTFTAGSRWHFRYYLQIETFMSIETISELRHPRKIPEGHPQRKVVSNRGKGLKSLQDWRDQRSRSSGYIFGCVCESEIACLVKRSIESGRPNWPPYKKGRIL